MRRFGTRSPRVLLAVVLGAILAGSSESSAAAAAAAPPRAGAADAHALVEAGRRATAYVVVEAGPVAGTGTGFCIDPSGLFLTNDHVVTLKGKAPKGAAVKVTLVLAPGTKAERRVPAAVLRTDPKLDLALLKVDKAGAENVGPDKAGAVEALELANPAYAARLRETDAVMALGFPFGAKLSADQGAPAVSVSTGKVTAFRRADGETVAVQFDGSINPGNSGGPLLDADGRVVGVVFAILLDARQLNLAVPVTFAWALLADANVVLTPRLLTDPRAGREMAAWLAGDGGGGRAAAPPPAAADDARKAARGLFAARYADRDPKAKVQLALALLEKAEEAKDDPVGRYALLSEAREVAVAAGEFPLAVHAAGALAEGYALSPLAAMADVVARAGPRAARSPDAALVVGVALAVAEAHARREAYADARKVASLVRSAAAGAGRNPVVQAQVRDRLGRLEQAAAEAERARAAADRLAADPKDPDANLTAGRYQALTRGDFATGAPLLALGRDPNLKAAAAADLAGPTTADARRAAGDLWWEQAAREAANPAAADACRARAGHWYRLAEPGLTGLAKASARQRLESLPPPPTAATAAGGDAAAAADGWLAVGTLESRTPPRLAGSVGLAPFTVPDHDQWWTGSNGVVARPGAAWERDGTVWRCAALTRRPWGVRFVHPYKDGHVLVSLGEKDVTVQAGGGWRDKKRNVPVALTPDAAALVPAAGGAARAVRSELRADGTFALFLDGNLVATARVDDAPPLDLKGGFEGVGLPGTLIRGTAAAVVDHAYHMGNSVAADLALYPSPAGAAWAAAGAAAGAGAGPAWAGPAGGAPAAAAPTRTAAAGGKGGYEFEDLAPPGGTLIGLTAHTADGDKRVYRLTPIYAGPDGPGSPASRTACTAGRSGRSSPATGTRSAAWWSTPAGASTGSPSSSCGGPPAAASTPATRTRASGSAARAATRSGSAAPGTRSSACSAGPATGSTAWAS